MAQFEEKKKKRCKKNIKRKKIQQRIWIQRDREYLIYKYISNKPFIK